MEFWDQAIKVLSAVETAPFLSPEYMTAANEAAVLFTEASKDLADTDPERSDAAAGFAADLLRFTGQPWPDNPAEVVTDVSTDPAAAPAPAGPAADGQAALNSAATTIATTALDAADIKVGELYLVALSDRWNDPEYWFVGIVHRARVLAVGGWRASSHVDRDRPSEFIELGDDVYTVDGRADVVRDPHSSDVLVAYDHGPGYRTIAAVPIAWVRGPWEPALEQVEAALAIQERHRHIEEALFERLERRVRTSGRDDQFVTVEVDAMEELLGLKSDPTSTRET